MFNKFLNFIVNILLNKSALIQVLIIIGLLVFCTCATKETISMKKEKNLKVIAKWKVEKDNLSELKVFREGKDDKSIQKMKKVWKTIYSILPKKQINKYVKELELYVDKKKETFASVNALDESNKRWIFGIDSKYIPKGDLKKNKDFLHTIIHEFGHLITLNDTQVESSDLEFQEDEKRYLTEEGLAKKNSYINQFVKKFWYKKNRIDEWDKIQEIKRERKRLNKLYDFYLDHEKVFFNDYAAESPEEDIAESWYFFVMKNRPKDKFGMNKKILFFYEFEELIELRKEIRNALEM